MNKIHDTQFQPAILAILAISQGSRLIAFSGRSSGWRDLLYFFIIFFFVGCFRGEFNFHVKSFKLFVLTPQMRNKFKIVAEEKFTRLISTRNSLLELWIKRHKLPEYHHQNTFEYEIPHK